ncbi:MAG: galactokinase [Lachnospiraceae bacterium]
MKEKLLNEFAEVFGDSEGAAVYFAPGRVNLIGEHTDYNGGHVLPCALSIGTYVVARKRDDKKLRLYSLNYKEAGLVEANLNNLRFRRDNGWANHPIGILWTYVQKGYKISSGFDMLLYGDIPSGAGLGTSASICVAMGLMIREMCGFDDISKVDIALFGQYAENEFHGINCGIMDQFASAMGKKNMAIFLDTSDLRYEYAPLNMEDYRLIITNSHKKRNAFDAKYNERRMECERALAELQCVVAIQDLGELTPECYEQVKEMIVEPVLVRRAAHAVYENQRTIEAVKALQNNDMEQFGRLMIESHRSLRDNYEVTGKELDTLVEEALKIPGVIGARMTGGGFGGCTVSLMKKEAVEMFTIEVGKNYTERTGYYADFYLAEIGDGARTL